MSEEKGRVAREGLVKELHRFKEILSLTREVNVAVVDEFFCSQVEIVGNQVRRGPLVHRTLFRWREFGLKLIGDFLGNLALDAEAVGHLAVIFLDPNMRVVAGID